jgi:hypothetical protein
LRKDEAASLVNETNSKTTVKFSEKYRRSIRCAVAWMLFLALWCVMVMDMGESLMTLLYSLGAYVPLLLFIMLRRPATPTKLDLLLIGSALPILFFAGLVIYPLVSHLRGVD